jgi:pseudaminic acid synthase
MPDLCIGRRMIGPSRPPFIIAEMSGNHNQSLDRALAIVEAAAEAGADAVKLQTYTADTMTIECNREEFTITDSQSPWSGKSLYELYREAHTPWDWHEPLFARCRDLGMEYLSTPFDETAVDFLTSLDCPALKIASFENGDLCLIKKAAETRKPLIISTGMATAADLDETVRTARQSGCRELVLLKCTSSYPAPPGHTNLRTLPHLRDLFDVQVGLSDHTPGVGVAAAAVALGAVVIEKHFTLSRSDGGVDAAFSLEPEEFATLVTECRRAWEGLGKIHYGPSAAEKKSLAFRRSLYITADLEAGDTLTSDNVRAIRPGFGLPTKFYDSLLGKRIARDVKRGTPLTWEILG